MHPTRGGLRIGKAMDERGPEEIYNEDLEWDRDGQYFHYLTKWMHALNRVSRVTANPVYNRWAIELARTANARFAYVPAAGGQKRMYWKMSIDLSRPLVQSMGHHDPLDGLITYLELQASAAKGDTTLDLSAEIKDMIGICEGKSWATADPLGIGELLSSGCRLGQLLSEGEFAETGFLDGILGACLVGLLSFHERKPLERPAEYRLAFRELGLSIGLHALEKLSKLVARVPGDAKIKSRLSSRVEDLGSYTYLIEKIEGFWLESKNREAQSWKAHRDINMVMLATSLMPEEYLSI